MKLAKICLSALLVGSLGGCASIKTLFGGSVVDFTPPTISKPTEPGIDPMVTALTSTGSTYLTTAAKYANERQVFDLPIFAAAAVGATALTFGWHTDWIKIAGISAGSVYAIREYYKTDGRISILLKGVNAIDCLRNEALVAKGLGVDGNVAAGEIGRGLGRVNELVQQKSLLQIDSISYSETAKLIAEQAKTAAIQTERLELQAQQQRELLLKQNNPPIATIFRQTQVSEAEKFMTNLPVAVTTCVAKAN